MDGFKVGGILGTVLGIIGAAYAGITISNDTSRLLFAYTYKPPLSSHEKMVIYILLGSCFILFIGICLLMCADWSHKSSQSDTNTGGNTTSNLPQTESRELDAVEALKKYKELLDANIITQEEFDEKKKQLLNQ